MAKRKSDKGKSSAVPTKPKAKATDPNDIHREALERYQRGFEHDRHNIDAAYEDLRFLVDEENAQWEQKALSQRVADGRPALTVNKCPQFVRQVTGDIRQLRPAIKVVSVDDNGSDEIAEKVLPGMIRYIENRSDAKGEYFGCADQAVAAGMGHLRVLTEYASEQTFNQEIRISRIKDGISVIWDDDAERLDRSDAMWCFVPVDMSEDSFKKRWPEATGPDPMPQTAQFFNDWYGDKQVRVAEYWRKVPLKKKIAMLPDGSIWDLSYDTPDGKPQQPPPDAEVREVDSYKVEQYLITASEILEGPNEWPSCDIPIVPMIGEELQVGKKMMRRGIVRVLKDSQRAYNYAFSLETEVIALQPKAPYIGTRKNFEKFQDQWETSNSKNWPYLEYEPDPLNGGAKPMREPPPQGSVGLNQLMETTSADMNAVTGIYPAALGAHSNETSGKAIVARQKEGDTGTFVYIDNFARAVRRVGQICVNLIPHIYDTAREMRIIGEDGKPDNVQINQPLLGPDAQTQLTENDVTVGAYDVVIEMGPSYSTKREEAKEGIQAFLQAAPQIAPMFIDLFAKMQDWPLADKVADRAKLLLPPAIQAKEAEGAGEPLPPQQPPQAPPPTPQDQLKAADLQQRGQIHQDNMAFQMQQHQDKVSLDMGKIQAEMARISADLQAARMGAAASLHKNMLDHHADLAGHAASIDQAEINGQASVAGAKAGGSDPRVDQLAQAVAQLRDVVVEIAQAVTGPGTMAQPPMVGNAPPPPQPVQPQMAPQMPPGIS